MESPEYLRMALGKVLVGSGGAIESADRLCRACVELLNVDGAAISVIYDGVTRGTFGSSGELSRRVDGMQFTFGEGPCLEAVKGGRPVFAPDLTDLQESRWPAFSSAALSTGIRSIAALPVTIASEHVGALDLFRETAWALSDDALSGALWAADLAALPLLDLIREETERLAGGEAATTSDEDGWNRLASLDRIEVHQATGMVMGQLDVAAPEALVRIRAYAFAHDLTASDVAWSIVERRLSFKDEDRSDDDGANGR